MTELLHTRLPNSPTALRPKTAHAASFHKVIRCVCVCADVCFLSPILSLLPLAHLLHAAFLLLDQGQQMSFGPQCGPWAGALFVVRPRGQEPWLSEEGEVEDGT